VEPDLDLDSLTWPPILPFPPVLESLPARRDSAPDTMPAREGPAMSGRPFGPPR
jgi:hypothetical protein